MSISASAARALCKWVAIGKALNHVSSADEPILLRVANQTQRELDGKSVFNRLLSEYVAAQKLQESVGEHAKEAMSRIFSALTANSGHDVPLLQLPHAIFSKITRYLPEDSLLRLRITCKAFQGMNISIFPHLSNMLSSFLHKQLQALDSCTIALLTCLHGDILHTPFSLKIAETAPSPTLLEILLETFDGLETLDLSNNQQIDDAWLARIIGKCPNLKNLNVSGCQNITAQGFAAAQLPSTLKTIDCSNTKIDESGVKNVFQRCQNLVSLAMEGCSNCLFEAVGETAAPSTLQHINLAKCIIMDEGIKKLFSECNTLRTLCLLGAVGVSASCFQSLDWPCTIQKLNLSTTNMNRDGLAQLFERCKSLQELTMHGCVDLPLDDLDTAFPESLELLSLERSLGNLQRFDLFSHCNKLKSISFRECPELNRTDLARLLVPPTCTVIS